MLLQVYLEENTLNALTQTSNAYVRKGKSLKVQELITVCLKKSEKDSKKTHPPKRREQRAEFYEIKTKHILEEVSNVSYLKLESIYVTWTEASHTTSCF